MSSSWLSRRPRSSRSWPILRCHFCLEPSLVLPRSASIDDAGPSQRSSDVASTSKEAPDTMRMSTGDPANWFCSACACWNRRDHGQPGGMATWDPAMADESANLQRMELRGKRPASQLSPSIPATSSISPFCHACSTNQSLVLSLLANYLPDPSSVHPAELRRLEDNLPAYRRSIEERYPPICERCRPVVAERLQGADKMVRSSIWAAWLERSRKQGEGGSSRPEERQEGSRASPETEASLDWVWRLRGGLWLASQISGLLLSVVGLLDGLGRSQRIAAFSRLLAKATIITAPISLLWIFWNPRWLSMARLHRRGQRKAHIDSSARRSWVSSQGALFLLRQTMALLILFPSRAEWLRDNLVRTLTVPSLLRRLTHRLEPSHAVVAALLVQPLLCAWAYGRLRIHHGSMVQLSTKIDLARSERFSGLADKQGAIESSAASDRSKGDHPLGMGVDPISAMSLGGGHRHNPIFGQPSMPLDRLLDGDVKALPPGEEMDWQPTSTTRSAWGSSSTSASASSADQGFILGPQRFFPPESITGVEELFGSVLDLGSSSPVAGQSKSQRLELARRREKTTARLAAALVTLTAGVAALLAWVPVSPSIAELPWTRSTPASWRVTDEAPSDARLSPPPLDIAPVAIEDAQLHEAEEAVASASP